MAGVRRTGAMSKVLRTALLADVLLGSGPAPDTDTPPVVILLGFLALTLRQVAIFRGQQTRYNKFPRPSWSQAQVPAVMPD